MSVKALSHVWEHSKHKGARLLVLLALADAANDDGFCWYSIATLAKKARQPRSHTQRYVQDLAASGEIRLYERVSYDAKKNLSNVYKIAIPGTSDALPPDLKGVIRPRVVHSRKIATTPKNVEQSADGSHKIATGVVAKLRSDPLLDPSIKENNISNTDHSPLADTPITSALSDGKSTVAAQDAVNEEVIVVADSTDTTPVEEEAVPVKGSTRSSKRKEKAIVHPDAAAEPSPYYKPTQDERHAMFEAVCAQVFGVTDKDSIREMARGDHSRAGKIVSWLLRQNDAFAPNGSGKKVVVGLISAPAQPQHVAQFAAGYKLKHRDASLPIDIVKFTDAWRAWASQQQRKQQAQQRQQAEHAQRAADAAKPRATKEELAAIKAEMEQARRQLKEGSAT